MPYPATTGEGRRLGLKHDYVQNQQLRWPKNYLTWAFALIETEENRLFPRVDDTNRLAKVQSVGKT